MNSIAVNKRKVLTYGALIIVLQMIIFAVLWTNPIVKDLMMPFAAHSAVKNYDFIGGEENWKLARLLFHIVFMILSINIYIVLCRSIPGGMVVKGIYFGSLIALFRFVPEAFNTWTLVVYPDFLIALRLLLGSASFLIFGVLVSVVLEKSKAIVFYDDGSQSKLQGS